LLPLKVIRDFNFKVLIVDEKTITKRDKERPEDCQMGERALVLLKDFISYNYKEEFLLDTSNLTIEETVNKIKGEENGI